MNSVRIHPCERSANFLVVLGLFAMCLLLLVILVAAIGSTTSAPEQLRPCGDGKLGFATYYGDHMVLQRAPQRAVLWGCGPLGTQVTVSVQGPTTQEILVPVSNGPRPQQHSMASNKYIIDGSLGVVSTYVIHQKYGETRMWRVMLGPVESGGPYNITAALTNHTNSFVTLRDVLFGDVWLCSGQSNMHFEVSKIFNASEELALASNYPHVRFFMVGLDKNDIEQQDLDKVNIPWSVPNEKDLASFSAVCWLFGRYLHKTLNSPIGLVESSWGGTTVEAWSSHTALKTCGLDHKDKNYLGPTENSVLWNAMIHPLLPMTIKGAIWYQGENNANYHRDLYSCTFPAMIDNWRTGFHEGSGGQTELEFPFGFVQLSTNEHASTDKGFPEIRWHQTADYGFVPNFRMKNTFMAVAMDLPDKASPYGTIHPRDKQDVAYRLTLGAQAVAYNNFSTFNGPFPDLIFPDNMYINITFDQELSVSPSEHIFEIGCSRNSIFRILGFKWMPASIMKWDNKTIQISTELCAQPNVVGAVRYAWRDWPCDFKACPVYGSDTSLPAPPFIIHFDSSGWKRRKNHLYFNTDEQKEIA